MWVDAAGEVVEGVVYLGDDLKYVDGDGYFWPLDPWGVGAEAFVPAELITSDEWRALLLRVVFANSDCTEPWVWHIPAVPGVVAMVSDALSDDPPSGLDGQTFVVPHDIEPDALLPTYYLDSGDCLESGLPGVLPVAELIEVEPPATDWVAPLHPEMP